VKKLLLAIAMLSLVTVFSGTARAYDPYYYESYDPYSVEVQSYDPYYELHQIHYQLYLRSYPTVIYPYYYVVRPAPFFVGAPAVFTAPASREGRLLQPVRRAR
jgi:hypothetical protein